MRKLTNCIPYARSVPSVRAASLKDYFADAPSFIAATQMYWDYMLQSKLLKKTISELSDVIESDTHLGIEVEVEDVKFKTRITPPPGWASKEDHSLRNGTEYVSTILNTGEVQTCLASLYLYLKQFTTKAPNFSWRTSVHVHVNVRDLLEEQILDFILIYLVFEQVLFNFVGNDRRNSIFCVPITESQMDSGIARFLTLAPNDRNWAVFSEEWSKYSALNLSRLRDYGTIEFRHMNGTWDIDKLIIWIDLILSIYNATKRMGTTVIRDHIKQLNTLSNYAQFRNAVFGWELGQFLGDVDQHQKLLSRGVSYAKRCLSERKAWSQQYVEKKSAMAELCAEIYENSQKIRASMAKKGSTGDMVFMDELTPSSVWIQTAQTLTTTEPLNWQVTNLDDLLDSNED